MAAILFYKISRLAALARNDKSVLPSLEMKDGFLIFEGEVEGTGKEVDEVGCHQDVDGDDIVAGGA